MGRNEHDLIDKVFPDDRDNHIYFRDHRIHHDLDDLDSLDDTFGHDYRHHDDYYYRRFRPISDRYYPRKRYHDEIDHEFDKEYWNLRNHDRR